MKLRVFFIFGLFLFGCVKDPYPAPTCRASSPYPSAVNASTTHSQAACVVRANGRLLVVQRNSGLYDLAYSEKSSPYKMSASNTSLSTTEVPSTNTAQNLLKINQCAAHQAMWQQTGFNVKVGPLLTVQKNGTQLYACQLQAGFDGSEPFVDVPPWQPRDVDKIVFITVNIHPINLTEISVF
jgi:hypothetical protein